MGNIPSENPMYVSIWSKVPDKTMMMARTACIMMCKHCNKHNFSDCKVILDFRPEFQATKMDKRKIQDNSYCKYLVKMS